jgi:phosphatidylglycerophosphate synthase
VLTSGVQLLVMLARDIFVSAGVVALLAMRRTAGVKLQARFPGKVVTSLQIVAVLVLTLLPAPRSRWCW